MGTPAEIVSEVVRSIRVLTLLVLLLLQVSLVGFRGSESVCSCDTRSPELSSGLKLDPVGEMKSPMLILDIILQANEKILLILGHAGRVDQIELQMLGQLARPDLLRRRPVLAVAPAPMVMLDDARVRMGALHHLAALDDGRLRYRVRVLLALHLQPLFARVDQLDRVGRPAVARLRSRLSVSDRFRRLLERWRRCFRCELCDRPERPDPRLISLSLSDTRRLRWRRRRPERDSFDE
uniref:Uncharacterized protein n=1 Tax=Anopheles coluzzii TaxID=1518534 RepID=A0A8W7PMN8_ANOCL